MSRSQKKTSIGGNTTCSSEKQDKRAANRSLRRIVKRLCSAGENIEVWPRLREVSEVWSFGKDGKQWFGKIKNWKKMLKK